MNVAERSSGSLTPPGVDEVNIHLERKQLNSSRDSISSSSKRYIVFDCTPENFVSEENVSKFFSTPRKLLLETLTVSGSTDATRGANCLLLQVKVKTRDPTLLIFQF